MTILKLFPNPIKYNMVKDKEVIISLEKKKTEQESNMEKINVGSTSSEKKYVNSILIRFYVF